MATPIRIIETPTVTSDLVRTIISQTATYLPASTQTTVLIAVPTATVLLTPTARRQPSDTLSPVPIPALACETHTAFVALSASAVTLKIGDAVKIMVTLNSEGCLLLGVPQYILHIQPDRPESIFNPNNPEPVVHYLGVDPGQSDIVEFDLQAVAAGQAKLTASASFEVHLGYPGSAYWGISYTSESLIITVAP